MENNIPDNKSLTAEELHYYNSQLQRLILNETEDEWIAFEKELLHLISRGFIFRSTEAIMVSGFDSESYFKKQLLRLIRERKNELVRSQNYNRVSDLRQVERKLEETNEKASLVHFDFFTIDLKVIHYKKPENLFIEALITVHLGSVLRY